MHGYFGRRRRRRQSARRHFRNGQRAAVTRAITAAKIYTAGSVPSLKSAAACCGSNIHYVRAAIPVIQSERAGLLGQVFSVASLSSEPLPTCNASLRVVAAYRRCDLQDLAALGRIVGAEFLVANVVEPALN